MNQPAASLSADLQAGSQPIPTRPAGPRDSIDGVVPGLVVESESASAVAAVLQWAGRHSLSVVIRGGGSKLDWGARPASVDVLLDLSRLHRLRQHQSGDLTVSVEAGARLYDLNQTLAQRGQWLPLDPPFSDAATIGGLLATNDSGPQRHRFGTPRDLVIGIEVATMDGQIAKAGGQVVKNVAGYDLSKIMSGSFGSLAAIVAATFKLSPLPSASRTVVIEQLTPASAVQVINAVAASQLEPVAFDLIVQTDSRQAPSIACLLRFASFEAVVDAETANAAARIAAIHQVFRVVADDDERQLWLRHGSRPFDQPGVVVRASWLPADVGPLLSVIAGMSASVSVELVGRIGAGTGLFRIEGDREAQAAAVGSMRASPVLGNVVVRRASVDLKSREWVWGDSPAAPVLAALKHELDPGGSLGAGRGPL